MGRKTGRNGPVGFSKKAIKKNEKREALRKLKKGKR